mmetsp:Transcript_30102/g.92873  ORF Transcript_30102/g.92873 Transcript_30102/m.92873 type:complete len:237 (+) Transcript_30102:427-1137(+)
MRVTLVVTRRRLNSRRLRRLVPGHRSKSSSYAIRGGTAGRACGDRPREPPPCCPAGAGCCPSTGQSKLAFVSALCAPKLRFGAPAAGTGVRLCCGYVPLSPGNGGRSVAPGVALSQDRSAAGAANPPTAGAAPSADRTLLLRRREKLVVGDAACDDPSDEPVLPSPPVPVSRSADTNRNRVKLPLRFAGVTVDDEEQEFRRTSSSASRMSRCLGAAAASSSAATRVSSLSDGSGRR